MSEENPRPLSEQIAAAKARQEAKSAAKRKQSEAGASSAAAMALRYSTEFVASVFIGILMGLGIDYWFGTKPWGLLVMLCFGVAAGVLNMVRAYQQLTAAATDETDAPKPSADEK